MLDRLDVHVSLPPVQVRALTTTQHSESSDVVRERVVRARERQRERHQRGRTRATTNAELRASEFSAVVPLCAEAKRLLEGAVTQLGLSARAFGKVLRVARTIADLADKDDVLVEHVAEAIQARLMDRGQSP